MPIDDKAIGDKLRQIRISRKLSQAQVAIAIHRDRTVVSKIECGKQSIDVTDLAQFSEVYDVEVIAFFERSSSGRVSRPWNEPKQRSFDGQGSGPEQEPRQSDNPLSYF